ncbi:alpha/beta hydrolase [Sporosarcina sp. FA9]|uniref:alpha/beta hydrolase n=1 Tax=Sporosarcina sp. FA9 TaxID=3413030 RepID=UPI003F65D3C7
MSEEIVVLSDAEEFYYAGNEIGVLVSHGFTGTTQSMAYLGKRLADEGFTVYGPRLRGHGTTPEDMETSTFKEWIEDVEAGLARLKETCSKVFVTGLSMGGTLTLYLAERHPELAGIMPINAAVEMSEFESYYLSLKGKERFIDGIGSDIKAKGIQELAYAKTPVQSMGELVQLLKVVQKGLGEITVPALILSSKVDHVVPPLNSQIIYEDIRSDVKELVKLEDSYHVATLDNDKEFIADQCISFIHKCME